MRNPLRPKNLKLRFWPAYLAGGAALILSSPTRASLIAGLPFVVVGLVIRGWGAGHLVKNDLLVRSGPYAHVRHPFYLGTLCIGTGFAAMLGGYSAAAALAVLLPWFFCFYFPRKERLEARRLTDLHGETFERYRAAVPALWPARRPHPPPPARVSAEPGGRAVLASAGGKTGGEDCGDRARWSWARYDGNNELGTLLACLAGLAVIAVWTLARG